MSDKKKQEIVVQSNKLIEAHYRLTLQEKRLVLWLISLIHREDIDFKKYQLKIIDFAEMMGLNSKTQYRELKRITGSLISRLIQIEDLDTGAVKQMAWLSFSHWEPKKGICSLNFHPELKPYLLQLKEQFTQIGFADFLGLNSVYSVRIFELLSQYATIGHRATSINEIRSWCGIGKDEYEKYNDLKRKVLNRAKTEINAKTDYEIDFVEIKTSRKVTDLEWTIKHKTHFEKSQSEKAAILEKELRSTTAILEHLLEFGFTRQAANRLVKNHEESNIVNAIKAVEIYMVKNAVKNPRALLETAIREKWHPEKYAAKKKTA